MLTVLEMRDGNGRFMGVVVVVIVAVAVTNGKVHSF